jgi:cytochrome c
MRRFLLMAIASAAISPVAASAQPGEARGRILFLQCQACHTLEKGGKHKTGPNLHGIFGKKAASQAGFNYSPQLQKWGMVWTPQTMDKWLHRPAALVPGNRMAFGGVMKEPDRQVLIQYMQAKTR